MNNINKYQKNALTIVIVSFNVKDVLRNCLNSISDYKSQLTVKTIVIDNNSADGTQDMVANHFPDITFIKNTENRGFAAANNQGLKLVDTEFTILLNPDTLVTTGSLDLMADFLNNNKNCGIVGPRLLNEDRSLQNGIRMFPAPWLILARHCFLKKIPYFKRKIDRQHMRSADLTKSQPVDQVSGAAMMFKSSLLDKIGLLDERFFVFFEEVDFCRRTIQIGREIHYYAEPEIFHLGGKCRDRVNIKAKIYYMESIIKYLNKHYPFPSNFFFSTALKFLMTINIIVTYTGDIITYPVIMLLFLLFPSLKSNKRILRHFNKSSFRKEFLSKYLIKFCTTR